MSSTTTRSLSFRPWAQDAIDNTDLKDVLQRVNLERGHFRDITEASLQEEMAAEGGLELSDSDHDEGDEDDENDEHQQQPGSKNPASAAKRTPTSREELFKAKMEMLQHVSAAEQDILMSLDFVSLLESKFEPGRASSTISPVLKGSVPTGSLGAEIWHRMPAEPARAAQEELLATRVRLTGLQRSADELLAAATRLQENVRKETRYWNQILAISDRGWNVLRLPRQPHLLGVHFGFSGSTSTVGKRDVAALLTDADGNISLERGLGTKPKALRAIVRRNDEIVGSSSIPTFPAEDETTLESRIRFARDSVFDEELYHEMIREGRLLAATGVTTRGSAITVQVDAPGNESGISISLELISTNVNNNFERGASHEADSTAHAIALAARLLLDQAHRERIRQKSQPPPPMKEKGDDPVVLRVLRPLISVMRHLSTIANLNSYLGSMKALLQQAKIKATCGLAGLILTSPEDISNLEDLVRVLMGPLSTNATLTVKPPSGESVEISFAMETAPAYSFGTTFRVGLLPQRSHRFMNAEDMMAGVDGLLASVLASALHATLDRDWKCSEREAVIRQSIGADGHSRCLKVLMNSGRKTLSLVTSSDTVTWRTDGEESETFWTAWKKVAAS